VYRAGQIVFSKGYGLASLEHGVAITPRTDFYIASTSKQFTAMAVAILAESGRLDLDASIRRYLPELPGWADPITVRHLVHHTSGIRDYLALWGLAGRSFGDEIPEATALALIARQRATDFPAGSRWSYSNSGYFLLSVIVKRVSGQSLRQFAEARIFGPLGMTETHFHDDPNMVVARRAEGYQPAGPGQWSAVRTSFALVGDGGLHTTIEDLAKWDANFYENRLGSGAQALIDRVLSPGTLSGGRPLSYAFGLTRGTYRGLPVVSHGGAFIGFRAALTRFPAQHFSVAVLCNDYTVSPDAFVHAVADRYLAGTFPGQGPTTAARLAPEALARIPGRYEVLPGVVLAISARGDTLMAGRPGTPPIPLRATSDTSAHADAFGMDFLFPSVPKGQPALMVMRTVDSEDRITRLGDPPALSPAERLALAGEYWSDELHARGRIIATSDTLRLALGGQEPSLLSPLAPGVFVAAGTHLEVARDRRGGITGFTLSAGRSRGIVFVRQAASRP
jgi:CubicO group peptidase (beta-lactamase class C family)